MKGHPTLQHVFGIADRINQESYVDRGGLDQRLRYALDADRHIAIHGESRQGKSWLRSRVVTDKSFVLVQCQHGASVESLLSEALGALGVRAELKATVGKETQGGLELGATGALKAGFFGQLGLAVKSTLSSKHTRAVELQTLGQVPGSIRWVAEAILRSGRRLVVEDCHYLSEDCLKQLAFILKALGAYGVHVMIIGIWPQDHLLTYYNGELSSRVEDIHLRWTANELDEVLQKGAEALNVSFTAKLRSDLVGDASGNVGLLQALVEQLCREEGVLAWRPDRPLLTAGPSLERARGAVAEHMRLRFETFATTFDGVIRTSTRSPVVYRRLLETFTNGTDQELIDGLACDSICTRMQEERGFRIDVNKLCRAMAHMVEMQGELALSPPVLMYNRYTKQMVLADRSLLFFRRYCRPRWPWCCEQIWMRPGRQDSAAVIEAGAIA